VFDFGLARREGKPDAVLPRELVGTISYIAPEARPTLRRCPCGCHLTTGLPLPPLRFPPLSTVQVFMSRKYGYSCDVWALGIILYEMLCGDVPFANETQIRMVGLPAERM
jgi:serine/threonine protein kinase